MSRITVVSTAYAAPTEERCRESVRAQSIRVGHMYIDAAKQTPPLTVTQNVRRAVRRLPPSEIVVWLDGDDWLAHERALERVQAEYEDRSVWLTYGSYRCADGRPGHCAPYAPPYDYRRQPWLASHLKTFRAGLFHYLTDVDLLGPDLAPIRNAHDVAIMIPMLEMAGPERVRFIADTLAIYNYANSLEHNGGLGARKAERDAEAWIRGRRPKERLVEL